MPVSAVHQVLRVTHMHVPSSRWISSWCHIENQNRLSGTTMLRKGTSTPSWRTCHRGTSSFGFGCLDGCAWAWARVFVQFPKGKKRGRGAAGLRIIENTKQTVAPHPTATLPFFSGARDAKGKGNTCCSTTPNHPLFYKKQSFMI